MSISSTNGAGAIISCSWVGASEIGISIRNGGSGFTSAPSFVSTPVKGGSGASATPTVNVGVPAILIFTASFARIYT